MKFKRDYIRIENLKQFLISSIKHYHPDDPRHTPYWASLKRKCIEGLWGQEFGGYRFMPGKLFFYGNFGIILDVDEEQNIREKIKPLIRDIEWERAYMLLEAEGFSGWSEDDEFTSDEWALELKKKGVPSASQIDKWKDSKRKRFFELVNKDGRLKTYISPRENIRKIHPKEMGLPLYWNPTKNISELGCLHKNTKVRMYDGTTKKAIDIQIGDKLMGPDSESRTVQNLVRGEGIMYNVSTRYGDTYRLTDSHIHRIRKHLRLPPSKKRKNWEQHYKDLNLDTNQILDKDKNKLKRQYEAIIQGVEYEEKELPFDPYFIGYWLGDGFSSEKMICYNEDNKKIIEPWLINYSIKNNWDYTVKEEPLSENYLGTKKMFRFRLNTGKNDYWNTIFKNNKHIPKEYLINSRKNRLKLLAGLLDSDGNYDKTRFKFYNSNFDLIKQVQELSRSLGFKTTISKRQGGINNSISYYLQITGDIHTIPTIYPRKKAKKSNKQGCRRNHINIDYTSGKIESFYGFEVDKDNLFLLEDFTVTHNARGGGKSYFYSIAVVLHTLIFDGAKYYTEKMIKNPPKAELCVGSGQANKSSDFCKKIEDAMSQLGVDSDLGAWGRFGEDEDYEPSIFYKEMAGSLSPNNKAKNNMWRHEYKVISNGRETIKGTGSYVAHVVYSPNKPDGAEAAAGGRYNYIIYEEQGLTPLLVKAWGSNKSTVAVGARQFGVQIALGTSGNMDTVQPAKEIFIHPHDFNLVSFVDVWEESGEIGFFLPAYMTASDFKDENGNTNYDEAIEFYLKSRARAESSNNPHILSIEKMNNPLVPSDMWQSDKGNILPVAEAQARERGLMNNRLYEKIYTPIKLHWDSSKPRGVGYEVDKERKPFFEHKYRYERDDLDGPVMIYEFPQEINGVVPQDMYKFIGHDPYVSDNVDEGDSLGATYIIMNPKYVTQGFSGNCIVASYIGKPNGGRKEYYSNLEKLLAFYGDPIRGLWFEANRGDECKNYFINKNKQYLLALRPQNINNSNIYQRKITQYGYIVGGGIAKADLLDKVHDWLIEPTTIGDETLLNIERIPDIFLIRQIISFDMKTGNYDAVMALAGAILGIKEEERNIVEELKNKNNHNPLTFLSQNSKMFKDVDPLHTLEKRIQESQQEQKVKSSDWVNEWDIVPNPGWSKNWK